MPPCDGRCESDGTSHRSACHCVICETKKHPRNRERESTPSLGAGDASFLWLRESRYPSTRSSLARKERDRVASSPQVIL